MSCDNATAPINITNKDDIEICEQKCSFQYHYGLSSTNITNEGQYLSIAYDSNNQTYPALTTNYILQKRLGISTIFARMERQAG